MGSIRPLVWGDDADDGTVLDAFVKLLVAEPAERNAEGLAGLVRRSLRVRGWLDAIDARIAVRAAELAAQGHGDAAATVLAGGGRRGRRDAEAAAARGAVCQQIPALGAALAEGTIGAGHVDSVVGAARHLDDHGKAALAEHSEALVRAAEQMSPEQFDREVRGLARDLAGDGGLSRHEQLRRQRNVARWVDRHSGMCKTLLSLDPLDDAKVWTAFNNAVGAARAADQDGDDRTWDQLRTDAIVDHITRPSGDGDGAGLGAEVSVLVDYTALLHGGEARVAETADGQELPVEVIRRLCCDGNLVPVWLASDFEVLALGRGCRLATRAQRRALRAMYRTCCLPDCTVGFDACRIHHVTFWEHHGATDLDNLVPICEVHHHLVHEGGWTLQLHTGRRITLHRPDGTVSFDGATTNRITTPSIETGEEHPRRPDPTSPNVMTTQTAATDHRSRNRRSAGACPQRDPGQRAMSRASTRGRGSSLEATDELVAADTVPQRDSRRFTADGAVVPAVR
jgi:Domain of unknown function (DUF222)